jgi:diaminohydroxyphosphoribosylaminopyrimidine deaminase/5-amino-6-(5-phosphoribosylamino)uracil reductase
MVIDNSFFMNLAIDEAWKYQGLTYPNPAVGCCIVGEHFELLSVEAHHKAGMPHAEVLALQQAYYKLTGDSEILSLEFSADIHNYLLSHHNNIFHSITLYTTLEPCSHYGKTPSCASLISQLGIAKVYVGSFDFNDEASDGIKILKKAGVCVEDRLLQERSELLLEPFKSFQKDNFVFFKWAQRLDATYDNGKVSSNSSRELVHAMRDRCDLLVIGGNTVRIDKPTLDARLVNGKAPDILIYSRRDDFDKKDIPLFSVEDREVFIADDFSKLQEYKNIMIEGTQTLFEETKGIVDLYLCFLAPTFGGSMGFENLDEQFEILNLAKEREDIIMWMKRRK